MGRNVNTSYIREVGRDLTELGEWLTQYTHGLIAKESLSLRLNMTEDVTSRLTSILVTPAMELGLTNHVWSVAELRREALATPLDRRAG